MISPRRALRNTIEGNREIVDETSSRPRTIFSARSSNRRAPSMTIRDQEYTKYNKIGGHSRRKLAKNKQKVKDDVLSDTSSVNKLRKQKKA